MSSHDHRHFVDHSALVRGLVAGSQDCFEKTYHLYSKKVYGVARSFYLSHDNAEEIVQDVFFKLWKSRANIKATHSLEAYLITITKNTVFKFLRSKSVRQNYLIQSSESSNTAKNSTEDMVNYNELVSNLNDVLTQVSPKRRKVFKMIKFDGLTMDEVAKKLNLSRRTVEHHLYHATKFIKSKLIISLFALMCLLGIS